MTKRTNLIRWKGNAKKVIQINVSSWEFREVNS